MKVQEKSTCEYLPLIPVSSDMGRHLRLEIGFFERFAFTRDSRFTFVIQDAFLCVVACTLFAISWWPWSFKVARNVGLIPRWFEGQTQWVVANASAFELVRQFDSEISISLLTIGTSVCTDSLLHARFLMHLISPLNLHEPSVIPCCQEQVENGTYWSPGIETASKSWL